MFDRVARSYDGLNRLFSLWSDVRWRRIAVRMARGGPGTRVLDVCTGTADLALEFVRAGASADVTGIDLSEGMLAVGREKVRRAGADGAVRLDRGNALSLPFPDAAFDVVSCAFGLRNLPDRARGIAEMARVLQPGGRLLVLEFAPPRPGPAGRLFGWYLGRLIPAVGGVLSGQPGAYRYLRDSIEAFLEPEQVLSVMRAAGLSGVRAVPLTAGIAYLYRGVV
jgi:demethylmenaquinone methyltransferase / 2-methoxy-6-polyprenyl-1,4-benzoquinol methylase